MSGCTINYTTNSGRAPADNYPRGRCRGRPYPTRRPGIVAYTMQCSSQLTSATIDWVSSATPTALSVADTTWAAHLAYPVSWNASAGPCIGSGGVPGDGWAGPKNQIGTQSVSESQPGAYLFTLTCGSGASASTSNIIVQVPMPRIQMYSTPGSSPTSGLPYTSIVWSASVGPCTYVDGSTSNGTGITVPPSGSATPSPSVAGTYLFTLTCGSGANTLYAATLASVPVNAPTKLTSSAASTPVDGPITLTWSSAGGICYATGGDGTAPWIGTLGGNGSGSLIVTSQYAGSITYGVTCNGEAALANVNYVAVPAASANPATPSVTLSSGNSKETVGQGISLVWSAKNADSCSASGGNPGDGWTGALALSGSMKVAETSAGTVTYTITCAGAPPAATASTSVVIVTAAAETPATRSSGGGGALDFLLLLFLGVPVGMSLMRARPRHDRA